MKATLLRAKIIEEGSTQNTIVYGPPGCGKTIFAMSIANHPKIERVFMFSIDNGFESGLFAKNSKGDRFLSDSALDKMEIFRCEDSPKNPRAWKLIDQVIDTQSNGFWVDNSGICSKMEKEGWSFFPGWKNLTDKDCVIFDQLTQIGISIHNFNSNKGFVGKSGMADTLRVYMEDKILQSALLQALQYAKFPTISVAQEFRPEEKSKADSPDSYPMMGSRDFCLTVASYFNNVVAMDIEAKMYIRGSSPTWRKEKIARSRLGIELERSSEYDIGQILFPDMKKVK